MHSSSSLPRSSPKSAQTTSNAKRIYRRLLAFATQSGGRRGAKKKDKSQKFPSAKKAFKRIVSHLKPQGLKSIKKDITKESDVSRNLIQLTTLPAELLLMIISHLDIVTQVCLQVTCRFFRALVIVDRVALEYDRCRKWAITCFLEDDMDRFPAKVACAFCKTVRPIRRFRTFNHEVGIWQSLRHPSVFRDRRFQSIDFVDCTENVFLRGIIPLGKAKELLYQNQGIDHRVGLVPESFDAGTVHVSLGLMTNGRQDA